MAVVFLIMNGILVVLFSTYYALIKQDHPESKAAQWGSAGIVVIFMAHLVYFSAVVFS